MKKAVDYSRKSYYTGKLSDEEIIGYQQEAMKRYADSKGLELLMHFSDVNFTGANVDRPSLQALLSFLEKNSGSIDTVLFYSVDRLGRNNSANIDIVRKILEYVNEITFVEDGLTLESTNPELASYIFVMLCGQAASFREIHSKKVAESKSYKRDTYKYFGGSTLPLGYTKNEGNKRLLMATPLTTSDPKEIESIKILQLIYYAALYGASLNSIGKAVDLHFTRSKKYRSWDDHSKIRYILGNPIYLGLLSGETEKGIPYLIENAEVEPLISPSAFYLIKHLLKRRKRGRQPEILHRFPYFTLCMDCGIPLSKVDDYLFCEECNKSIQQEELLRQAIKSLHSTIKVSRQVDFLNEMVERYQRKVKETQDRLKRLEQRYQSFNEQGDTKQINRVKKELYRNIQEERLKMTVANGMIEEFREMAALQPHPHQSFKGMLIKLPYLLFVKIPEGDDIGEVQFLFHDEVFLNPKGLQEIFTSRLEEVTLLND
jgi:DNA invertase Pin-like site-specific DNA recombinase